MRDAVAQHFLEQEPAPSNHGFQSYSFGSTSKLPPQDANLFLEIFWDLFREGIIGLGLNDLNNQFPWYHITQRGQQYLRSKDTFRFHDGATYAALVKSRIPNIHPTTLAYLSEAAQAYAMNCYGAAGLTLTTALEHSLSLLFDALKASEVHAELFAPLWRQSTLSLQLHSLIQIIKADPTLAPSSITDDLNSKLAAITEMIQRFRDEARRPTGRMIDRDDCHMYLQLFVPCCQKIYQLTEALT